MRYDSDRIADTPDVALHNMIVRSRPGKAFPSAAQIDHILKNSFLQRVEEKFGVGCDPPALLHCTICGRRNGPLGDRGGGLQNLVQLTS